MPATWDSVASNPEYQKLPPDQQEAARQQYFQDVVAPQVPADHVDMARQQFDASTKSDANLKTSSVLPLDMIANAANTAKQGLNVLKTAATDIGKAESEPLDTSNPLAAIGDIGGRAVGIAGNVMRAVTSPFEGALRENVFQPGGIVSRNLLPSIVNAQFHGTGIPQSTLDKVAQAPQVQSALQDAGSNSLTQAGLIAMMPRNINLIDEIRNGDGGGWQPPPAGAGSSGMEEVPSPTTSQFEDISPKALQRAKDILRQAHQDEGINIEDIAQGLEEVKSSDAPVTALDVAQREIGGVPVSGQNFQGLAMASSRMPGKGASLAGEMAARGYQAKQRIGKIMDESISSDKAYDISDKALSDMQTNAPPAYEKAFANAPIHNDRVAGFLEEPEIQSGIKRGMQIQRLEARANNEPFNPTDYGITGFNEAGDPIVSGVPNMRLLNAAKKGLDAMIRDNTDISGKTNELGRALTMVKKSYVNTLKEINPDYEAALDSYADPASRLTALERGRNFMKMDKEEIEKFVKDPDTTTAEKQSFLSGVRRDLQDRMSTVGDNANAITKLWRENIRDRLEPLFEDKKAFNTFAKRMKQEATMADNNYVVRGNSITMKAQQYGKHIDQPPSGIISRAASFVKRPVSTTAGAGLDMMSEALKKSAAGMSSDTAAAIMQYLTTKDPAVWRTLDSGVKRSIMSKASVAAKTIGTGAALGAGIIASKNAKANTEEPDTVPDSLTIDDVIKSANQPNKPKMQIKKPEPTSPQGVPHSFLKEEGIRNNVYRDKNGNRTVGVGFNMDNPTARNIWQSAGMKEDFNKVRSGQQAISRDAAQKLLRKSYEIATDDIKNLVPNFDKLGKNQQEAAVHLAFQYGRSRLKKNLPGVLSMLNQNNAVGAAARLLASDYGKKFKKRATALARMLYDDSPYQES